jgi:hypothetical protein
MRDAYLAVAARVEQSWRDRFGGSTVDALRTALETAEATYATRHADTPWVRHVVGKGFTELSRSA